MSGYTVISNVGRTLIKLIWNGLKDDSQIKSIIMSEDQISLSSPADLESDSSKKLSLFLYHITEFTEFGNLVTSARSPLYLRLHYLITPLAQNSENDQIILGKIMQILYDNPILNGAILQGNLSENGEKLRVTLESLSMDELNKIWIMLGKSYRLSVGYSVDPVRIDSMR